MSKPQLPPQPGDTPGFKVLGFSHKKFNGGRIVAYAEVKIGDIALSGIPLILCADSLSELPAYKGWNGYGLMIDAPSNGVWFNEETRGRLEAHIVCAYLAWLAINRPQDLPKYGLGEQPESDLAGDLGEHGWEEGIVPYREAVAA